MKPLCITILAIGVITAIILKPDFWFPIILVGTVAAIAIDEVE